MSTPHLDLDAVADPTRREPLGFVISACTRATEMALDDVQSFVEREDLARLPPHTRDEVRAMLTKIAVTAAALAERLED